jgi:hypothetical protein
MSSSLVEPVETVSAAIQVERNVDTTSARDARRAGR